MSFMLILNKVNLTNKQELVILKLCTPNTEFSQT